MIVNEPAASVELDVTAAVGDVPQLAGVPIVGAVVCNDLTWALLKVMVTKLDVVPAKVMTKPEVSMLSKLVPAAA